MGRETIRYVDEEDQISKRGRLHPVWRGIGCLTIVLLGILGYFASGWLLNANNQNQWIYIPPQIMAPEFAAFLPPGTIIRSVVGGIAIMLGYTLISVVYAIVFPLIPGKTDVPALKRTDRRKM